MEGRSLEPRDVVLRGRIREGAERGRSHADAYHIFAALCRHLGDLHGASWMQVKGIYSTGEECTIYLRIQGDCTPIKELRGETLVIGARSVQIRDVETYGLRSYPDLFCPFVVISPPAADRAEPNRKRWRSEDAFGASVGRHLEKMGVKAEVTIGHMVVRVVAGHKVAGWPVTLRGLSDADSFTVQRLGVGGLHRLGAGVFSRLRQPATVSQITQQSAVG